MKSSLTNYLRSYRQKAHLTQDEVAFLMGGTHGSTITRHEEYARTPTLQTALAYAAIYSEDPRTLFAGVFEERQRLCRKRAGALLERLSEERKTEIGGFLEALRGGSASYYVPCEGD